MCFVPWYNVVPCCVFPPSRGLRLVQARTQKENRPMLHPGLTPMGIKIAWNCLTLTSWWCWERAASARWGRHFDVLSVLSVILHVTKVSILVHDAMIFTNAWSMCRPACVMLVAWPRIDGLNRISTWQQTKDESSQDGNGMSSMKVLNKTYWLHWGGSYTDIVKPRLVYLSLAGDYRTILNTKSIISSNYLKRTFANVSHQKLLVIPYYAKL